MSDSPPPTETQQPPVQPDPPAQSVVSAQPITPAPTPTVTATVAVPVPPPAMKVCPFCAEEIRIEAKKCRYCGEFLEVVKAPETPPEKPAEEKVEEEKQEATPPAPEPEKEPEKDASALSICIVCLFIALVIMSTLHSSSETARQQRQRVPELYDEYEEE